MSMMDSKGRDFLTDLASKKAVPGGGGAAALGGAIGIALSTMVGNLTVGKKKYADVEDEVQDLIKKGYKVQEELMALIDRDAEVFEPLSKAYGLPRETEEEKKIYAETLERESRNACSVPLEIMRRAYEGIMIHQRMGQIGTKIAISDVGCGVVFLKSALLSGKLNVAINLNAIKDEDYLKKTKEEMDFLVTEGCKIADETYQLVLEKITK